MWLIVMVACVFFVGGTIAIMAFGIQRIEQERSEKSADVLARAPEVHPGHCMLCDAPLRRPNTVEQVVYEVERRIDADMLDVVHLLGRPASDNFARLYQA